MEEITEIKISSDWKLKFLLFFGLFYNNYVQVKTKNNEKKFYCLFLDVDCHDENWTEKTLDDLEEQVRASGVDFSRPMAAAPPAMGCLRL